MKKTLLAVMTAVVAIMLTACGADKEVTYGGYSADDFRYSMESMAEQLSEVSYSDLQILAVEYEREDPIICGLFKDYLEIYDEMGAMIAPVDFEIDQAGKTITAKLEIECTQRNVKLVYVMNKNRIDDGPTAINMEGVYTLGEIMQKAGMNTVMGISIVFIVLVLMSLIISCFKFVNAAQNKAAKPVEKAEEVAKPVAAAPSNDTELIAVIAAAIAASTGASTDSFVVRSIKKRR